MDFLTTGGTVAIIVTLVVIVLLAGIIGLIIMKAWTKVARAVRGVCLGRCQCPVL